MSDSSPPISSAQPVPGVVLKLEVACALPERQRLLALEVDAECTVFEAVQRSGILVDFPELDVAQLKYGIWGRVIATPQTTCPRDGDRIEIYRPLLIDPKAVRQARADARAIKPKRLR
jgi:putative ubiquitin-RnfH superfamily antitoxin RatB of RatAB toxin-antitoxin module